MNAKEPSCRRSRKAFEGKEEKLLETGYHTPHRSAETGQRITVADTVEYKAWNNMKRRCLDKNHPNYHRYGGRGIKICDRWMLFCNFLNDMGSRPEGLSLDRINNDGDYEPKNCRWASNKEQGMNKRNVRLIEGKTMVEIANQIGVDPSCILRRIQHGYDPFAPKGLPRGKQGKKRC